MGKVDRGVEDEGGESLVDLLVVDDRDHLADAEDVGNLHISEFAKRYFIYYPFVGLNAGDVCQESEKDDEHCIGHCSNSVSEFV